MLTTTIADVEGLQWHLKSGGAPDSYSLPGNSISLAAAVELAETIERYGHRDLRLSGEIQFASCPVWNAISSVKFLKKPRTDIATLTVSEIPSTFDSRWFADEVRCFRNTLLARRFPKALATSLTGGVFEMVDNVWRHSKTANPGLLAYDIRTRAFTFAVCDSGVGVLASLRKSPTYSHLSTSVEALEEAVKPNVSSLPDSAGLGFSQLVRALADLWGRTRLRSGQGVLEFNRETSAPLSSSSFLPKLDGFQISGICRLR